MPAAEMDKIKDTDTINFRLSQVDTAFTSRSYDVFSCLDSIEAKHIAFEKNQPDNRSDLLKPDPVDEPVAFKTKFKIPKGMPRKSRLPGYGLRPDNWKTYSLLDVSPEQMSDLSNRRTALDFIDALKNRTAAGSCVDATDQMDDDCVDACTVTQIGQSCFASHKQHVFQKPAVQPLKQIKEDEDQLEFKAVTRIIDVGPNLLIEETKDENEGESCETVDNDNLRECAESSVNNTLHLSTKADSLDVHFQTKGLKCKNKHIRPRNLAEESEEDDDDSPAVKDKDSLEAGHADCESRKNDSDESDKFSDCAVENDYSDEELQSGLTESDHEMNNWSDVHYEEQDDSNDDDDDESVNSSSCFVFGQEDIKPQNCEKDDCTDDLDTVD